jgi:hypothetical protein
MIQETEPVGSAAAGVMHRERDGSNPIERKALYRAHVEMRSMAPSLVVQIALWPDKLADWARETGVAASVVYNMLAGVKPYHRVRALLARRLDVPKEVLDHLIDAPRPEPRAKLPPDPPPDAPPLPAAPPAPAGAVPISAATSADPSVGAPAPRGSSAGARSRPPRRTPAASPASQISLNF